MSLGGCRRRYSPLYPSSALLLGSRTGLQISPINIAPLMTRLTSLPGDALLPHAQGLDLNLRLFLHDVQRRPEYSHAGPPAHGAEATRQWHSEGRSFAARGQGYTSDRQGINFQAHHPRWDQYARRASLDRSYHGTFDSIRNSSMRGRGPSAPWQPMTVHSSAEDSASRVT